MENTILVFFISRLKCLCLSSSSSDVKLWPNEGRVNRVSWALECRLRRSLLHGGGFLLLPAAAPHLFLQLLQILTTGSWRQKEAKYFVVNKVDT